MPRSKGVERMTRSRWIWIAILAAAAGAPVLLFTAADRPELPTYELEILTSSKTVAGGVELEKPVAAPAMSAAIPAPAGLAKPQASGAPPASDAQRARLVSALQSELRRVGCYSGPADGTWSAATQEAMRAFAGRVGARVPLAEPSHILETLVEGYQGVACEGPCVAGRQAGWDGKCPEEARKQVAASAPAMRVINAPTPHRAKDKKKETQVVATAASAPPSEPAAAVPRAAAERRATGKAAPSLPAASDGQQVPASGLRAQPAAVVRPQADEMAATYVSRPIR
jgi:peptidoglycan hydrolase-like protein with peptidoglycan-binding domain